MTDSEKGTDNEMMTETNSASSVSASGSKSESESKSKSESPRMPPEQRRARPLRPEKHPARL